ncbi:hypothetical protein Catovirus_1_909 [Catovirus CTV1]|uniref:Uncharacterized protein n=1 Tax=Catovirus CTV1 TaxID=1977631 RepID=A0A1V0SAX4_9VIRU|nr:hypothetical protein Catovirus_1_909 [Catovirus CTV1]
METQNLDNDKNLQYDAASNFINSNENTDVNVGVDVDVNDSIYAQELGLYYVQDYQQKEQSIKKVKYIVGLGLVVGLLSWFGYSKYFKKNN